MSKAKLQPVACFCSTFGSDLPLDEVVVPEVTDYLVHYCGLACYSLWRDVAIAYVEGCDPVARRDPSA